MYENQMLKVLKHISISIAKCPGTDKAVWMQIQNTYIYTTNPQENILVGIAYFKDRSRNSNIKIWLRCTQMTRIYL